MSDILARNLQALRASQPAAAAVIESCADPVPLEFAPARQEQALTARLLVAGGSAVQLASAYRPLQEAAQLADAVDLKERPAAVVVGFGLGYHVRRLHERQKGEGLLVVFEPDAAQLRRVLEELDYSDLLAPGGAILVIGEDQVPQMQRHLERSVTILAQGVAFLTHPPTRQRHAEAVNRFLERFRELVAYCRTTIATTLVNSAATCRNLSANLGLYAAGSTVNELKDAARGHPAVLVSAGPSLKRNLHRLLDRQVRGQVVLIAVQTVLKTLLEHGIRPDFVTALDYHPISGRFYEGLPPLPDVTLVAEPKSHPSIPQSFPGPVRLLQNDFLDRVLGPLARPIHPIAPGATVAHLSFYLAQHLGCDPIILIGQDLGFSDGLYYCPGTAIHQVWAPELGAFNTLETMELKRILRHKGHLRPARDIHDRPIYTDEQMVTYLAQFERDFAEAKQTILDATEGGLPKRHTRVCTLEEALRQSMKGPVPPIPRPDGRLDRQRLAKAQDHVRRHLQDIGALRRASEESLPILDRMRRDQKDACRMDRHFADLNACRSRVNELGEAFVLVNYLNQVGAFNRLRADRRIRMEENLDPFERQRRQLDRDEENLRWLIEGCREAQDMFTEALERLQRMEKSEAAA